MGRSFPTDIIEEALIPTPWLRGVELRAGGGRGEVTFLTPLAGGGEGGEGAWGPGGLGGPRERQRYFCGCV